MNDENSGFSNCFFEIIETNLKLFGGCKRCSKFHKVSIILKLYLFLCFNNKLYTIYLLFLNN